MKRNDKNIVLQALAQVLQDNQGQRITLAMMNGILATVDASVPVDLEVPEPPHAGQEG